MQQLVWLKLDCPVKGSARGLCLDFFNAIEVLLGTSFYVPNRANTDVLLAQMAQLAAAIGLGVLVIDEVHRLCEAFSGGEKALLNFLVKLANTVKIPVVLIGTFKSLKLFSKDFSLARRIAGQGDHLISHMTNNVQWQLFLKQLWRYQFTNVESPLSEGIANTLYDESQGVIDIAVKLYMQAQWSVIGTDCESITPDLITNIAAANFNAARPMLQALRANDIEKLAQIDDLVPQDDELQTFLKKSMSRIIITGGSATLENLQQTADKAGDEIWHTNPINEITSRLLAVGIDADSALKCATIAFLRFKKTTDILQAIKEALRLALAPTETDDSLNRIEVDPLPKKSKEATTSHQGDIRDIAGRGKKLSTDFKVHNLKESGVIKSPGEFL